MARFRRKKRRKEKKNITEQTPHASLAAMAPVIQQKRIFESIHDKVLISQKSIEYRPSDKLVIVIRSMLAGNQTISDVNWTLRLDKPLMKAFGYTQCPDQSTLQKTFLAATEENVSQLRCVASSVFAQYNLFCRQFHSPSAPEFLTIDFDF